MTKTVSPRWPMRRLKFAVSVMPSNVDKLTDPDHVPVRVCNYTDVYKNDRITGDMDFMTASATPAQISRFSLRGGDVLITKDSETPDDIAVPAYVDPSATGVVCGYHLALLRPIGGRMLGRYLFWAICSRPVASAFTARAQGITRFGLTVGAMGDVPIPVPPTNEQRGIADFLDRETAKIDALIAAQERLIALLDEKRQATITHAVTKGLDPTAPMKESGIEWLGEVPEHWEITSLKRFWSVIDCKHVTAEFVDEGIYLASIREVQGRFIDLSAAKKTTELFYELLIEDGRRPQSGDLIFSRNATVGEVAQVADWHPPFAMGQDVCLLRKQDFAYCSDFLQAALRSKIAIEQLALCMIGSTFKRVNVEEIRNLIVPMPPPEEQSGIAVFLDHKTAKLDALTAEAQHAIDLLKERRTALITAAVTGQIDVTRPAITKAAE